MAVTHARVMNGVVLEVWSPPDFAPNLPPPDVVEELAGRWIACGGNTEQFWVWDEGPGFRQDRNEAFARLQRPSTI